MKFRWLMGTYDGFRDFVVISDYHGDFIEFRLFLMIYIDDLYTDELMTIGISPLNMAVNLLLQDGDILEWSPNDEHLFQMACNMLAPPGGFARLGTRSTVTTCDEYPQPFVVLVVMVLILLCFFHIKCGCSQVDFISFFSDAIDHWMFWQCPNLSFFRQIWRKKSTITCNLQRFHLTRFAYIYRQTWSIHTYIYIYHIHQK